MILKADNKKQHKWLKTTAQTKQQTRFSPFQVTPSKCTTTDKEIGKWFPSLQRKYVTRLASPNTISFHVRKNEWRPIFSNVSERTAVSTVNSSCCVNDSSFSDLPDPFEASTTSSPMTAVSAKPLSSLKNKKPSGDRVSSLERKCLEGNLHFPEDQVRNVEILSLEASLPLHRRIFVRFSRYRQANENEDDTNKRSRRRCTDESSFYYEKH